MPPSNGLHSHHHLTGLPACHATIAASSLRSKLRANKLPNLKPFSEVVGKSTQFMHSITEKKILAKLINLGAKQTGVSVLLDTGTKRLQFSSCFSLDLRVLIICRLNHTIQFYFHDHFVLLCQSNGLKQEQV